MNTKHSHKKWGTLALLILASLGAETAKAATAGSLTVTIRPNAAYSLTIDTSSNGQGFLNLGLVDLSGTTQTVRPATVR